MRVLAIIYVVALTIFSLGLLTGAFHFPEFKVPAWVVLLVCIGMMSGLVVSARRNRRGDRS